MNAIAKGCVIAIALAGASCGAPAQDQAASLDALLNQVKQGRAAEAKENKAREAEFARDKAGQAQRLQNARALRVSEEAKSEQLENAFDENEIQILQLQDTLTKRLGSLKELFGVLQQAAGDASGQFEHSLTNIQYPDRGAFLAELVEKMGSTSRLASIEDIERLWFELQREMTESGKVVRFPGTVVGASGDEEQREIIRVGVFNLVAHGRFLEYVPQTGRIVELPRQPKERFVVTAQNLTASREGMVNFGLDPTRGQLLGLLVQEPTLEERRAQGGIVGEIIIYLGIGAVALAALKLVYLLFVWAGVAAQKRRRDKPERGNPLGRILAVYHANTAIDTESLDLKLGEAVLKEIPRLQFANTLIKVIAVVAPLLGLLGTVTGMIITFQAITLYGTGDPKLMAGGISQALVTTVLGLCVAIPTVLMHTTVAALSKSIIQVLEEQAAGMVAEQSEMAHKKAA